MCDHYVDAEHEDEPSGEEGSLEAALLLADEDGDDPPSDPIDKAIWNLQKNSTKSTGKSLAGHARDELDLAAVRHVWPTVRQSLERAFPGWPDAPSPQYEHFGAPKQPVVSVPWPLEGGPAAVSTHR